MNRFVYRSLFLGMTVLAITFAADNLQAQKGGGKGGGTPPPPPPTNVRYRIHWVVGPAQATQISVRNLAVTMDQNGVPTSALIVGNYNRSDRTSPSAFVYDMQNPSDPTDTVLNRFWDIEELVGPAPASIPWTSPSTPLSSFISVFRGVNSAGLVAGYVGDPSGARNAVYLDLNAATPSLVLLPQPQVPFQGYEGNDVTELGDILVKYTTYDVSPVYNSTFNNEAFVFTPATNQVAVISDALTSLPIQFLGSTTSVQLNRFGVVAGEREDNVVIRHSMLSGQTVQFPGLEWAPDLNDLGQFPTIIVVGGTRGRFDHYAARIGANGSVEWSSTEKGTQGFRINNQEDLLFKNNNGNGDTFYYHDQLQAAINLKALVIPESDPNSWFRNATSLGGYIELSDADSTGFGWVACSVSVGSSSDRMAILIPEVQP